MKLQNESSRYLVNAVREIRLHQSPNFSLIPLSHKRASSFRHSRTYLLSKRDILVTIRKSRSALLMQKENKDAVGLIHLSVARLQLACGVWRRRHN